MAGVLGAAVIGDTRIRNQFPGRLEGGVDPAADAIEPLGRARTAYVELGSAYVGGLLLHDHGWANATLRIAAGYVAADAVTAMLKGTVGRHRPGDGRGPFRFQPSLRAHTDWDSFPSGHTTHVFALAAGLAAETGNRWIGSAAFATAGMVGLSRVYDRAHWTSDVVAGAVIGTAVSQTVISRLERARPKRDAQGAGATLIVSPRRIGVLIPVQ